MRLLDRVVSLLTMGIGSLVLTLMVLQIAADIFARNVLGSGIPATPEIVSRYLMVLVSFLPIAFAELHRRHIEASVFTGFLPDRFQVAIAFPGVLLGLLVYGVLCYGTWQEAMRQSVRGAYVESGTLAVPTWPSYWILPVSFGLMALVLAMRLVQLCGGRHPDDPSGARGSNPEEVV